MKIGQALHANSKGFLFCYISSFHRCPGVLTIETNGTAPTSKISGYWIASDLSGIFGGNMRACSIIHQIIFSGFLAAFLAPTKPYQHNI